MKKPKTLTVFVIVSMTMIVAYAVVSIWLARSDGTILPSGLTAGWFAYWGSEIFLTARIKSVSTKTYNTITEADDVVSDSDEIVG